MKLTLKLKSRLKPAILVPALLIAAVLLQTACSGQPEPAIQMLPTTAPPTPTPVPTATPTPAPTIPPPTRPSGQDRFSSP